MHPSNFSCTGVGREGAMSVARMHVNGPHRFIFGSCAADRAQGLQLSRHNLIILPKLLPGKEWAFGRNSIRPPEFS